MPATCFNRLPRGAGAIAQRCRLSLQGLSEAWFVLRALSAVRSEWCAPEGYKCMHRRAARVLAPVFAALRCEPACLLVSYRPLALERGAAKRSRVTASLEHANCSL